MGQISTQQGLVGYSFGQVSTQEVLVSSSSTQNSQICVGSRLFRVPIPSLEIVNK